MSTEGRIAELESRIDELEAEQQKLRGQLLQAEIDQWEGRIEDLEVQLHLGTMDLDDRMRPLVETLRNRWLDARAQAGQLTDTADDVIDRLRSGLDQAMKDIRTAVLDAKGVITR